MTEAIQTYLQEFTQDIVRVFPEYSCLIQKWGDLSQKEVEVKVWNHLVQTVKPQSLFILLKNEALWDNNLNTEFLPGIVFRVVIKAGISDETKEKIWKYLQFPVLYISMNPETETETETEEKETEKETEERGGKSGMGLDDFMNPEFFEKLKEKKIGKLIMELAEECKDDLVDLNINPDDSPEKILQEMLNNPSRWSRTITNMKTKMDNLQASGESEEVMNEAMELLQHMDKSMIEKMLSQMGLGRKTKVNTSAMQAKMAQSKAQMDIKARLRAKLAAKKAQAQAQSQTPIFIPKVSEEEQQKKKEEQDKKDQELFALFDKKEEEEKKQQKQKQQKQQKQKQGKKTKK